MGANYAVQVAYGFVMKEPPAKFPDDEQWYEDAEHGVMSWLNEKGFNGLMASRGGDMWGGDFFYYVVISSSSTRIDPRYSSFDYLTLKTPTANDVGQLVDAYNALDLGAGELGWVVMLHVT